MVNLYQKVDKNTPTVGSRGARAAFAPSFCAGGGREGGREGGELESFRQYNQALPFLLQSNVTTARTLGTLPGNIRTTT